MTFDPCPVTPVAELVFAKWTTQVLWTLGHHGRTRFTELQRLVPAITPKVLAQRLRQMERDGLVVRTYHAEVPPRVDYEMTPLARTLLPVFQTLVEWSETHLGEVARAREAYDAAL